MIDRLTAIFLAGGACFAALLPLEFRSDLVKPELPAPAAAKADDNPAAPNEGPAVKQLVSTILARPLFSSTRRPAGDETNEHPDTSLNNLRLTGILIMPDERLAIFASPDGKPLVRSEGDAVSNWHIDTIAAQSVSLSGPTGTTMLAPKADPNLARLQSASRPTIPPPQPAASSSPPPAPNGPVRPSPVIRSDR